MRERDILILRSGEILSLLEGRELDLINTVRQAYETHAKGNGALPHSTFLRLPNDQRNRFIALPAYLGGSFDIAGIKWIASFPDNIQKRLDRASAVIALNSTETGRPTAILEGSIISSKRTAASAALAAQSLGDGRRITSVGVIGCGLINFETIRFLLGVATEIDSIFIFDVEAERALVFQSMCKALRSQVDVQIARDVNSVFRTAQVVSLATTAVEPHIFDISTCVPGAAILHTSLRDISPDVILSCDNIVDDIDHVCRAQTSVHLAEELIGNRAFIRCTLSDILLGIAPEKENRESVTIFSPFGLGVLDLAVSKLVVDLAVEQELGAVVSSFLSDYWIERDSIQ
jgi:ornithine cyclodeaminase